MPADGSVVLTDVTSARAVLNLCGPLARAALAAACEDDVANERFRYGRCRTLTIGSAPVLAMRIGYTGELGWELHVPTEYGAHVADVLREAGAAHGLRDVGYRAIDTLRMEKGYLYWSTDITPDTTPWEAGLDWRVDLAKGDFVGRDALVRQQAEGVERRLCTFTLESMAYPVGGEAIIAGDRVVASPRAPTSATPLASRSSTGTCRWPSWAAPTGSSRSTARRTAPSATIGRCTTPTAIVCAHSDQVEEAAMDADVAAAVERVPFLRGRVSAAERLGG